ELYFFDFSDSMRIDSLNLSDSIMSLALLPDNMAAAHLFNKAISIVSYSSEPEEVYRFSGFKRGIYGHISSGDLNSDGLTELVAVDLGGSIYFINTREYTSTGFDDYFLSSPALGDLDDDGKLEVVLSTFTRIFTVNSNGTLAPDFPVKIDPAQENPIFPGTVYTTGREIGKEFYRLSSPVLGDVDGDGKVDIVFGTSSGLVYAINVRGEVLNGFPLSTGGGINSAPALGDVDSDGDIEIAVISDDEFLYVWDLPGKYEASRMEWQNMHRDSRNSSFYSKRLIPVMPPSKPLMVPGSVFNYPNPVEGDFTTIRYFINDADRVIIRIFDMAGDLVAQLVDASITKGEHNEIKWYVKDVDNGVYFAKVRAEKAGQSEVKVIKIAVIR
ncbi:MAG: T9SS type A sorting domain-containing protein, partial [Fidelibacterota bacterium]